MSFPFYIAPVICVQDILTTGREGPQQHGLNLSMPLDLVALDLLVLLFFYLAVGLH